jgi:hypothetical protein
MCVAPAGLASWSGASRNSSSWQPHAYSFCYLSTMEIHTEFSVIESEAESVGPEIATAVRVIATPYCSWMCEGQDRQCTYNITLRRVSTAIVAAENE